MDELVALLYYMGYMYRIDLQAWTRNSWPDFIGVREIHKNRKTVFLKLRSVKVGEDKRQEIIRFYEFEKRLRLPPKRDK